MTSITDTLLDDTALEVSTDQLTQIAQRSTERVQRGYFNFATDLPVLDAEAEAASATGSRELNKSKGISRN